MYYYIFSHFHTTIKSHKILKNYYTPLLFVVASSKKAYAEISISVIYSIICMSIDIEQVEVEVPIPVPVLKLVLMWHMVQSTQSVVLYIYFIFLQIYIDIFCYIVYIKIQNKHKTMNFRTYPMNDATQGVSPPELIF